MLTLDFTEMDKLENYLKDNNYTYERKWMESTQGEIIKVYGKDGELCWDVILHQYSYGNEKNLLEACGDIVDGYDPENDYYEEVEGYLTADEIIERLKNGQILQIL